MSFPVNEIVVTGDWAFQKDEGNFVWLFKKDNAGNWKWARVISNSTKPLQ